MLLFMGDTEVQKASESTDLNLIPGLSRPRDGVEYRKFASDLASLVRRSGNELRGHDIERFLLKTPDFSATFDQMQKIVSEKIKSGSITKREGEALIGAVIYNVSSYICSPDETNRNLLRITQNSVDKLPTRKETLTINEAPKPIFRTRSEIQKLINTIDGFTRDRNLSDREFDVLINKTIDIEKVLEKSKELIANAVSSKIVSQEMGDFILGEALDNSSREVASPAQRASRIIERIQREIQKREKQAEKVAAKVDSTPTDAVFAVKSQEIMDKYGSSIFVNLQQSFLSATVFDQQYVAAGVSQICIDLAGNKELKPEQKRNAVCIASRAVDKDIGFRTATNRETFDLFKKHLEIELINQRDGFHYPTNIENARKIAAAYSPIKVHHTTSAYTIISTTKTRDIDREHLQNAPTYRRAVEELLEVGSRVQSDPANYSANKTKLINALNAVSNIPERVIGENLPNMAKGLAHQLTYSYSDDLDSVNKGILGAILKGLNSSYDRKNRMLVFEVYMEKKIAKETAKNLLDRINKTVSDPGRLDFTRDGYIANIRRDNMNRDIDNLIRFLQRNYSKQDYQFNSEIQDLQNLKGNLTNKDALNRVRNFLSSLDAVVGRLA